MSAVPSPVHADFMVELFGDGIPRVDQIVFRLGIADDENDAPEPVSQDFETVSFFNVSVDGSHHFTSLSADENMRKERSAVQMRCMIPEMMRLPFFNAMPKTMRKAALDSSVPVGTPENKNSFISRLPWRGRGCRIDVVCGS